MYLFIDLFRESNLIAQVAIALFLAILFLQSGLDKVFDWKGNMSWLKSHFSQSPFKGTVPFLLAVITVSEVTSGILSAVGFVMLLFKNDPTLAFYGAQLSAVNIIMLFFGQRIAKDYAGAATLVGYFILTILAILVLGR